MLTESCGKTVSLHKHIYTNNVIYSVYTSDHAVTVNMHMKQLTEITLGNQFHVFY